jgi:hypothetical protein
MYGKGLHNWLHRAFVTTRADSGSRSGNRSRLPVVEELEARNMLSFYAPVNYTTGTAPFAVTTADLRGIGVLDVVEVNNGSNTVSVLLGNGDGTFGPRTNYNVGNHPEAVSIGDLNFDGIPDLIVANYDSNNVTVLFGKGDGTFTVRGTLATGVSPESVAAADFFAYGGLFDFVVANNDSNTVSVLLNNFDGQSFTRTDYFLGGDAYPVSVAVADLNFDGYPDIVVANNGNNTVSILYNNGDGTFQDPVNIPVGASPEWVAVGDLRAYGYQSDIVTANFDSNNVSVVLNNFDGTFAPAQSYAAGRFPDSLAIGDMNFDGYPDLVTTNFLDNTVSVLLNNGDGTFGPPITASVGKVPSAVAVGDFNGDGANDLAVANTNSNNLSVLINDYGWPFVNGGGSHGLAHVSARAGLGGGDLNQLLPAPSGQLALEAVVPSSNGIRDESSAWDAAAELGSTSQSDRNAAGPETTATLSRSPDQSMDQGETDTLQEQFQL